MLHRHPADLPVEDPQSACGSCSCAHVSYGAGLSLYGSGIALGKGPLRDRIAGSVPVLQGPGIGRFQNADILSGLLLQVLKYLFQISCASVPVHVVGKAEYVIVHLALFQDLRPAGQFFRFGNIREVDCHPGVRHLSYAFGSRIKEVSHLFLYGLSGHAVIDLVPDLHHIYMGAGFLYFLKALLGILSDGFFLFGKVHLCPGPGRHLLSGIRPEVRIVEIHQKLHAVLRRHPSDLSGPFRVAVAASEAVSLFVIGIVPDTHPDPVDAGVGKNTEKIRLLSLFVKVADPALCLRKKAGYVGSPYEVLRDALYRLDENIGLFRSRGKDGLIDRGRGLSGPFRFSRAPRKKRRCKDCCRDFHESGAHKYMPSRKERLPARQPPDQC